MRRPAGRHRRVATAGTPSAGRAAATSGGGADQQCSASVVIHNGSPVVQ
ncbi:hypothetical protein [Actinacidiphila rubida]|nr:hypothetical protein [Actinacidiphila rubida]